MNAAYPIVRHARPDAIAAYRGGRPVTVAEFLGEVIAVSESLPSRRHVANLCKDRYRFTVGLAAALLRQQVTLLPPDESARTLGHVAKRFPDTYCLSDTVSRSASIHCVRFPHGIVSTPTKTMPAVPASQIAAILFTSGSTGMPQPHSKSWGVLVRSSLAAGELLGVSSLEGAAVVGTAPHEHSYGLESTVLLALQHGLAIQAERPFYPGDICASLESVPRPRILVTTPLHIRSLLAEPGALPRTDLAISAASPLSPQNAVAAEARLGGPLREIYGCSETGQLAVRRTAETAEWRCMSGVALRQDAAGTWASGAPVGGEKLLNDVIELLDSDRFLLHGRTADLVNIAGKRTSLAHLNFHLNSIDGVRDGAFIMPDGEGEAVRRLIALVVAPGVSPDALRDALRERIDPVFLPRPVCFVDALPRNDLGKLPREAALRLVAAHAAR